MTSESLLAHVEARLHEIHELRSALAKEAPVLRRAATRLRLGFSPDLVLAEVQEQGVAVDRPSVALRAPIARIPRT